LPSPVAERIKSSGSVRTTKNSNSRTLKSCKSAPTPFPASRRGRIHWAVFPFRC
jgi:hypothetical protein